MYPLIIYPLAPSVKDWYPLVLCVYLRRNPSSKKGTLVWTSRQSIQLPSCHTAARHDEVVPIEVLKPLFGPGHRRTVVKGIGVRIRDTLFSPRLLSIQNQSRSYDITSEEDLPDTCQC